MTRCRFCILHCRRKFQFTDKKVWKRREVALHRPQLTEGSCYLDKVEMFFFYLDLVEMYCNALQYISTLKEGSCWNSWQYDNNNLRITCFFSHRNGEPVDRDSGGLVIESQVGKWRCHWTFGMDHSKIKEKKHNIAIWINRRSNMLKASQPGPVWHWQIHRSAGP